MIPKHVGLAAEHLVLADLLLHGYAVNRSSEAESYDLALHLGGMVYARVQVKSVAKAQTLRSKNPVYRFETRRSQDKRYAGNDFELFAFVALDTKTIGYAYSGGLVPSSVTLSPEKLQSLTLEQALGELIQNEDS